LYELLRDIGVPLVEGIVECGINRQDAEQPTIALDRNA
jgi:hypothetical protein